MSRLGGAAAVAPLVADISSEDDAIKRRAAEVAELVHSVIDIPDSPLGAPPHGESTHKKHFGIPDAFAKSISKEDYHKYYEPHVVSIGPFHHGKPHLAPMEKFKRKAVMKLAQREEVSIEEAYASIEQDLLRIAKEYYDVSRWDGILDHDWCLMMFLDGCFVIEFISDYWLPITKKHDRELVHRDLLLLENQLPYQVLRVLTKAFRYDELYFSDLFILGSLVRCSARADSSLFELRGLLRERNAIPSVHLLQRCRDSLVSLLIKDDERREYVAFASPAYSVTELKKVGIRCTLDTTGNIHFESSILSGHLFLPQLTINEWTVTLIANIVAYEDSCSMLLRNPSGFSSVMNFMCMLTNGEEDVKELRARGILNVNIKDDDKLINFLRDITAHTESNHKVIMKVQNQIFGYFKHKRLPLRIGYAEFKQKYFSSPWSFLVFLAVIFSVSMTVIQTVLTGIQTYK